MGTKHCHDWMGLNAAGTAKLAFGIFATVLKKSPRIIGGFPLTAKQLSSGKAVIPACAFQRFISCRALLEKCFYTGTKLFCPANACW